MNKVRFSDIDVTSRLGSVSAIQELNYLPRQIPVSRFRSNGKPRRLDLDQLMDPVNVYLLHRSMTAAIYFTPDQTTRTYVNEASIRVLLRSGIL